ncbi:MAG: bifunctional demethylmenaquinone methyltransferase/2-methoxy-6-polyprenyl-1,4-benzoquinol methylase UbiE [Tepidisphaeraceae bacterium]
MERGLEWSNDLLQNPHATPDKRRRVQGMFAAIAQSYDLNNRLHSFWRDQAWRRAAVRQADLRPTDAVVDVACGTGDLTLAFEHRLAALRQAPPLPGQVVGIDFTLPMLPIACAKAAQATARFVNGDAQELPLPDACCDVVSIAFGIRNVQNVDAAFAEFHRILRPGGRVIVLEFSEPENPIIRALNRFYGGSIMPRTATWISGDRSGAYKYLPKSVETFMSRQQMSDHLAAAGFSELSQRPMTFGVCVCYRGVKH